MKRFLWCCFFATAGVLVAGQSALAAVWVDNYDVSNGYAYAGTGISTVSFDDWGYSGPGFRTAKDWTALNGGFGEIGQRQHVVTLRPDYLTPDSSYDIQRDLTGTPVYTNANMDGSANFYHWGYTGPGYDRPVTEAQYQAYLNQDYSGSTHVGSQFNNMLIDLDGDYHVAKEDMSFGYYDTFSYVDATGVNPSQDISTNIQFQPYATSDAVGWCGSVLASHPGAVEPMAGQLKFDFAFDVSMFGNFSSTNIVPEFEMRSWGTLDVDVWVGAERQTFSSSAVVNNTNPDNEDRWDTDPNFANQVSFHGGGVLPDGVWLSPDSYEADEVTHVLNPDGTWNLTIVDEGTPGAIWHGNAFAGRAFILRADGIRLLEWSDPIYDQASVPEPASMLLLGSGLAGLIGVSRKRK